MRECQVVDLAGRLAAAHLRGALEAAGGGTGIRPGRGAAHARRVRVVASAANGFEGPSEPVGRSVALTRCSRSPSWPEVVSPAWWGFALPAELADVPVVPGDPERDFKDSRRSSGATTRWQGLNGGHLECRRHEVLPHRVARALSTPWGPRNDGAENSPARPARLTGRHDPEHQPGATLRLRTRVSRGADQAGGPTSGASVVVSLAADRAAAGERAAVVGADVAEAFPGPARADGLGAHPARRSAPRSCCGCTTWCSTARPRSST